MNFLYLNLILGAKSSYCYVKVFRGPERAKNYWCIESVVHNSRINLFDLFDDIFMADVAQPDNFHFHGEILNDNIWLGTYLLHGRVQKPFGLHKRLLCRPLRNAFCFSAYNMAVHGKASGFVRPTRDFMPAVLILHTSISRIFE